MNPDARRNALLAALLLTLALAALWSARVMAARRDAAVAAVADVAAVERLAAQLVELRKRHSDGGERYRDMRQLAGRIEQAMAAAGLQASALQGVYPQGVRRLGDSDYVEKPTTIELREVELVRLAAALCHLAEDDSLELRALRLRLPRQGDPADQAERWDVELTLSTTYLEPPRRTETR